jgi:oligopeptide/dipeptide ABC transporter ATP-binding protein
VPEIDPASRRSRIILPGDTPPAGSQPGGCPFHPRCPLAVDLCRVTVPPPHEVARGRLAACHRAEEVLGGLRPPSGAPAQLAAAPPPAAAPLAAEPPRPDNAGHDGFGQGTG